jgi:hypothetical protein
MPRVDSFACAKPSNHFARNQAAMARTDFRILIARVYTIQYVLQFRLIYTIQYVLQFRLTLDWL